VREYLDFEKPLKDLEGRIAKLVKSNSKKNSVQEAIEKSSEQLAKMEEELFANLSPWQQSQIARHPQRPSISDYLEAHCSSAAAHSPDRYVARAW